jgi:hypothetical protein
MSSGGLNRIRLNPFEALGVILATILIVAAYNWLWSANSFRTYVENQKTIELGVDLPDTSAFQESGRNLDIGYQFDLFSGGHWVVVRGNNAKLPNLRSVEYLGYDAGTFLRHAGIKQFPAIPSRGFRQLMRDTLAVAFVLTAFYLLLTLPHRLAR